MKLERDYISSQETNACELEWWNSHAGLVSKVWEMHSDISWTIRKHYLSRAQFFFKNSGKKMTILELGCGSGWVGQSIAGPDLRIIGTDFSAAQIDLARENAKSRHVDKYCEYRISNESDWTETVKEADGILIHAFLHHLDGRELDSLLCGIRANARPGTKIWIYEPSFYQSPSQGDSRLGWSAWALFSITNYLVDLLRNVYNRFHLIDHETEDSFSRLTCDAEANKWYLSPKEVPFNIDAFSRQLTQIMELRNQYWATIFLIGWAYHSNLLTNAGLRKLINRTILPLFSLTDRLLAKEREYLKRTIVAPLYAFHVWEGIVR